MKRVKGVYFGYNTPEDVSAICLLAQPFLWECRFSRPIKNFIIWVQSDFCLWKHS